MAVNEVQLERRLTQMEDMIAHGFSGVHGRLDKLNGQVATNVKVIAAQADRIDAIEMEGIRKDSVAIGIAAERARWFGFGKMFINVWRSDTAKFITAGIIAFIGFHFS